MGLILAPSYDDQTRQQIEDHLSLIRTRRMAAAIEFHAGQHAKLQHESAKIQTRFTRAYELLGKKLVALEKAEQALSDQLAKCEMLRSELGVIDDLIASDD